MNLVTGATGHIGNVLVKELLKKEIEKNAILFILRMENGMILKLFNGISYHILYLTYNRYFFV